MEDFRKMFPTAESCYEYLIKCRWPEGFICPECKGRSFWFKKQRSLWFCRSCRKEFSSTTGTLMYKSHIPIQEWFWAAYMVATITPGISALQLQRQLGIGSYRSAWYLLNRLRKGMVNENRELLGDMIEADETIIGGPAKGKVGRGAVQAAFKSLVLGAVEMRVYQDKKGKTHERAGRLRLYAIKHADAKTIKKFLESNVVKGSFVRTDGWRGYSKDALIDYKHEKKIQGELKAHQLAPHIHRVFSNLKTWLQGTHHGVEPKYLQGYLDEFVFRFNRRQTPMATFRSLLGISVQKQPLTLSALKSG
ncbi:MAG: DDE transposase [Elusimicrobia bacterium CG_4_10_14_3_um_filter_49_12_50_7]|nr:MAG: DDE transposase [Elusimicrobia bacterium CG_4_10_14_3_um_filter_49_12_50_7]